MYKFILTLFFFCITIYAGTTGKIAGVISDASTGEGLIGANILVEGTSLGAATDINGNYTILNLPPGVYSLKISSIGYKSVTVNDVQY